MEIKNPSVLAFERKLANSDGLMFAGSWANRGLTGRWQPIRIQEKDVRGTISNRLKAAVGNDPAKLDAEIQKANLQRVDMAALPFDSDTLKVSFTLRVLGDLATPSACNSPTYQNVLRERIGEYIRQTSFQELALRYAENIANGRFLWRNRVGVEAVEVHVKNDAKEWIFNSHDFDLRQFSSPRADLQLLAKAMSQGLTGTSFTLFTIDGYVKLGYGQEVFPSQELVLDKDKSKSKFLYKVNEIAALHSQKIGNALRTIDTWYPEADGPIAVEPYGSVTNRGKAYRQPKEKKDFYSLFDDWMVKNKVPELNQQHYVIATLIRGGVFGKAD